MNTWQEMFLGSLKSVDIVSMWNRSVVLHAGALGKLRKRAGVKTLSDLGGPIDYGYDDWLSFSIYIMDRNVNRNLMIHFDLTYMKDVEGILNNTGKYKDTITAGELRYIRDNWYRFSDNVKFYYYEMEVTPPWE